MAYDEVLAIRIRTALQDIPGMQEKKMFGGVGYILGGNMACGVISDNLIVRVGSEKYQESLALPHTRVFDMTGRPMTGWIIVEASGVDDDAALGQWLQRGVEFVQTLPAKTT